VSGWVLPVAVLYGALDERRARLGLSWLDLSVTADVAAGLAAGSVPDTSTLGVLLGWLGWDRELALRVVGDGAA
jgi:hypothetical protein